MPVFGFALAIGYGPYMVDGSTAVRLAIMAVALPLLLRRPRITIGHALLAAWIAYAALSISWSPDRWNAMQHLVYLAMGGLAFCSGGEAASLKAFGRGAAVGLAISSALAIAQTYGFAGIWQGASPGGLFYNKNYMAEAMALCAMLCLAYGDWPYVLGLIPGILLAHCRGADGALALGALTALIEHRRYIASAALVACACGAAFALDQQTLGLRATMWLATVGHLTLLGHGLGSFYVQYPAFGPLIEGARPEYPHNEYIYALYELGIGAAAPLALGAWCVAARRDGCGQAPSWRPFLAASAFIATLSFPLQNPFTLCIIFLVAGNCAYSRRSLRYLAFKWRMGLHGRLAPARAG